MVVNLDNGMLGRRENKFTITTGNMNKSYKHNSAFFKKIASHKTILVFHFHKAQKQSGICVDTNT